MLSKLGTKMSLKNTVIPNFDTNVVLHLNYVCLWCNCACLLIRTLAYFFSIENMISKGAVM